MRLADSVSFSLATRLQRVTSQGIYIPEIDGMRCIAIGWVVLFHIQTYFLAKTPFVFNTSAADYPLLFRALSNGGLGVPIFFALSGFILGLPFAKCYLNGSSKPRLPKYLLRRLTRLEPPYIIAMTLLGFVSVIIGKMSAKTAMSSLAASLFYLHDVIFHTWSPINGVAWSLEIEVQFYLFAPLLAWLFFKVIPFRRAALLGAMVLLPIVEAVFSVPVRTLLRFLHFFLAGFLVIELQLSDGKAKKMIPGVLGTSLGMLALTTLVFFPSKASPGAIICKTLLIFLLLFCALNNSGLKRILSVKPITIIGGMCYSIYLLHYPLIVLAGQFTVQYQFSHSLVVDMCLQMTLLSSFVLMGSMLFYLLVERPCMNPSWPRDFMLWVQQKMSVHLTHAEGSV